MLLSKDGKPTSASIKLRVSHGGIIKGTDETNVIYREIDQARNAISQLKPPEQMVQSLIGCLETFLKLTGNVSEVHEAMFIETKDLH